MNDSRTSRRRRTSAQPPLATTRPAGTPAKGLSSNTGPLATAAWLVSRGVISAERRWQVEIAITTTNANLDEEATTMLRVELYGEEWGYWFRHDGKVSWIRVTDVPFVHGRDDHSLLAHTPALESLGRITRHLERRFGLQFDLDGAKIHTSLLGAEPAIYEWLRSW